MTPPSHERQHYAVRHLFSFAPRSHIEIEQRTRLWGELEALSILGSSGREVCSKDKHIGSIYSPTAGSDD